MSPVDNKFFELIIPIATFLTGTLSGIMLAGDDKDLRAKSLDAANKPYTPPPPPPTAPTMGRSAADRFEATAPSSSPFGASVDDVMNSFMPTVASGFGGKEAPTQPPHPER